MRKGIINQTCECDDFEILRKALVQMAMFELTHPAYSNDEQIPLFKRCPYCFEDLKFMDD